MAEQAAATSRLLFRGATPHTRAEFQDVLRGLCAPFADEAQFARVLDGVAQPSAVYAPRVARLELVSRLLWGLAPLAAGGGEYEGWPLIRREITAGTDPADPLYWGEPVERDQRIVESAALGFALALAPDRLWDPLDPTERKNLADWLRACATAKAVDNNWLLFATLVDLGLRAVGEDSDERISAAAFARVDEFYRGDGWYSDGPDDAFDYYGPWAIHFYTLLHARLAKPGSPFGPERRASVTARANEFGKRFAHWLAEDGSALAFGRSLTYRFAQGSFLGALAFADVPAVGDTAAFDWGRLRGAWARHLRWWGSRPVLNGDGTLSIGYGYPSLLMSESYNAIGSPYWAFKAFLPLALPADHPFWTTPEQPLPPRAAIEPQPTAGLLLAHDHAGHVTALAALPGGRWARHGEAKYGKLAYSTAFGFSVSTRAVALEGAGVDSMLGLSDDGVHWRVRGENLAWSADADGPGVLARWQPWPDVEIETRMVFADGWHIRTHRVATARALQTAEGAFCVPYDEATSRYEAGEAAALAVTGARASGLRDLRGPHDLGVRRVGEVLRPDPNGHLLWPRTLLPVLRGELEPGEHVLTTAVYADATGDATGFTHPPTTW
ncbi:DUF2264 domain-containing protein [Actinospica durhamensis]|uniref:DUF2264 domain-containing protein n=1 Tax=Actinospica durhamensis TaxID=1508375 RepID=A0A941EZD3_9ACTN|nr:DUF2264 domain-containing protein [Actinospica durhamensis]MBR7836944.1 DUF2264 domain-containing protein [Actinospica durhamensis]